MCSNQKGRQLSAFLLLPPLRNVELPEIVVLPGNVEPPGNVVLPGNVEPPLGTSSTSSMMDEPVLVPPRQPRNTALSGNAERPALHERRVSWERRAPARWCGLLFPLSRLPH